MIHGGDIRPYREPPSGGAGGNPCVKYEYARADDLRDKFTQTTTIPQPGVGNVYPFELYNPAFVPQCNEDPTPNPSGMHNSWIGGDSGYYTLVAGQVNTAPQSFAHVSGEKLNFAVCYASGFRNAAAVLQWNGTFGFLISDPTWCVATSTDDYGYNRYTYSSFVPYQATAPQTRYLKRTIGADWFIEARASGSNTYMRDEAHMSGEVSVDRNSGEKTSTLKTTSNKIERLNTSADPLILTNGTETSTDGGSGTITEYDSSGSSVGVQTFLKGLSTTIDELAGEDFISEPPLIRSNYFGNSGGVHPTPTTNLLGVLEWFTIQFENGDPSDLTPFPPVTDRNNYSGSASANNSAIAPFSPRTMSVAWTRNATMFSWAFHYDDGGNSSGLPGVKCDYTGTITLSDENTAAAVKSDGVNNLLALIPLNDDALYPWRLDGKKQVAPLVSRLELHNDISPTGCNPYTVDDLTAPIADAAGNAPFSGSWTPTYSQRAWFDESIYQWRWADGESSSTAAATHLIQLFDGSIQGAFKPAGYLNYFRFDFEDWRACCFVDPITGSKSLSVYKYGDGMSLLNYRALNGVQLPRNCTQWTNNYDVIDKPPGAFMFYGDAPITSPPCIYDGFAHRAGAFWIYKYAEIADRWLSFNAAEPAGKRKFDYDETQVFCYDGATLTDASESNVTNALAGIWGGACVGGFYSGCSAAAGVLTLGTKVYDLPGDWQSRSDDDATCFGKLRWPTVPALLGRVWAQAIDDSAGNAPFTTAATVGQHDSAGLAPGDPGFTTPADWIPTYEWGAGAQAAFGMTTATHQETVDLYTDRHVPIAASITATRLTDTTFTLPTAYPTLYWVMISGAPAYYFDDNYPKGDALVLEFQTDHRTNGEYHRLEGVLNCSGVQVSRPTAAWPPGGPYTDANSGYASFTTHEVKLPFIPCCPAVICVSPNATDVFTNGVTIPFPATFALDQIYGSRWYGYVQTTMLDPLYQTPHHPCSADIVLKEDTGVTCPEDSANPDTLKLVKYYPHAPVVEARQTLPSTYGAGQNETAPALPAGLVFGWLSPVLYNTPGVAAPPSACGFDEDFKPLAVNCATTLHASLCAAVADESACRFKTDYQEFTTGCP